MLETTIVIVYKTNNDDLAMQQVRAFIVTLTNLGVLVKDHVETKAHKSNE